MEASLNHEQKPNQRSIFLDFPHKH